MPGGGAAVRHGQDVCFHFCDYCEIVLSRLKISSLDIPAGSNPTMARRAWMVPIESESPDTELVQGKITIIYGLHPSGIACHGDIPRLPKQIFRRLYLQKKALLC